MIPRKSWVWYCNTIFCPKLVDQSAKISCEEEEEEEEEEETLVSCSVTIRFVGSAFLVLHSGIWDARISALIPARSGLLACLLHSAENVKPLRFSPQSGSVWHRIHALTTTTRFHVSWLVVSTVTIIPSFRVNHILTHFASRIACMHETNKNRA